VLRPLPLPLPLPMEVIPLMLRLSCRERFNWSEVDR
jgi:hypothetical protein